MIKVRDIVTGVGLATILSNPFNSPVMAAEAKSDSTDKKPAGGERVSTVIVGKEKVKVSGSAEMDSMLFYSTMKEARQESLIEEQIRRLGIPGVSAYGQAQNELARKLMAEREERLRVAAEEDSAREFMSSLDSGRIILAPVRMAPHIFEGILPPPVRILKEESTTAPDTTGGYSQARNDTGVGLGQEDARLDTSKGDSFEHRGPYWRNIVTIPKEDAKGDTTKKEDESRWRDRLHWYNFFGLFRGETKADGSAEEIAKPDSVKVSQYLARPKEAEEPETADKTTSPKAILVVPPTVVPPQEPAQEGPEEEVKRERAHILAKNLRSMEVLVKWDGENGYRGTGIPVMSGARDTLNLPDEVGGNYSIEIYDTPEGVVVDPRTKQIFTTENVRDGVINGALVYRDPKTGKIEKSVRLIVGVSDESDPEEINGLREKISDLEDLLYNEWVESQEKEKKRGRSKTGLILGGNVGGVNGVQVGFRYDQVAFVAGYNWAGDRNESTTKGPVSPETGMQSKLEVNHRDNKGFGVGVEYHPSGFFVGAGLTHWAYNKAREIVSGRADGSLKGKSEAPTEESALSGRVYGGYTFRTDDGLGIGIGGGYDSRAGFLVNARMDLNLQKKTREKKK